MDFAPLTSRGGYLPLEDYGLIGDGSTAALVGRDGSVAWLCVPRFDSPPLFCSLLDSERGGFFRIAPDEDFESRHHYERDSGILVTQMRTASSQVEITDALTLRAGADLTEDSPAGRQELLRWVKVLDGSVRLNLIFAPYGECDIEPFSGGLRVRCKLQPGLELHLSADPPLRGNRAELQLDSGKATVLLRWGEGYHRYHPVQPEETLRHSLDSWRKWMDRFRYEGPNPEFVRRSTVTLKLLDYFQNGAIVAAPTFAGMDFYIGTSQRITLMVCLGKKAPFFCVAFGLWKTSQCKVVSTKQRSFSRDYVQKRIILACFPSRSTPTLGLSWATFLRPSATSASLPAPFGLLEVKNPDRGGPHEIYKKAGSCGAAGEDPAEVRAQAVHLHFAEGQPVLQ